MMKGEGETGDPGAAKPARRARKEGVGPLAAELQARIAEADWLKAHYDEHLRSAFAQIASLQARLKTVSAPASPTSAADHADAAELTRLRAEVERLSMAEARYLDRIEELKEAIEHDAPA